MANALDGRSARRLRGREAVLTATVDLIVERHEVPSADDIADRAGVSVSSVFRYYESLDELRELAQQELLGRYETLIEVPPLEGGGLEERIARLVSARIRLYREIEPLGRLLRSRALVNPHAADVLHQVRVRFADQCRAHFAPELAPCSPSERDDLVALVASLTAFESWAHLRELGRTPRQVHRAWVRGLGALLVRT